MKYTVVLDFDGVIHSYSSGWRGKTCIPDPPVPGIREEIYKMRQIYRLSLFLLAATRRMAWMR